MPGDFFVCMSGKHSKMKYIKIIVPVLIIIILSSFVIFRLNKNQPPLQEIKEAREYISQAKLKKADLYAPYAYSSAENTYDSVMQKWNEENKKFILNRGYEEVRELAEKAQIIAMKSLDKANENSEFARQTLQQEIQLTQNRIDKFQPLFKKIPLPDETIRKNAKAMLLFQEAKIAYRKSNYLLADDKLKQAQSYLSYSYGSAEKKLDNYFSDQPKWESWTRKSIERSRKKKLTCIIIDKFSRKCMIYKNGQLKQSFDVDLGKNWIGTKLQQGDKSTPEGFYRIEKKLTRSETKYHKALLLNYPNEDDEERFRLNKENGVISSRAAIGGLIEIHGNGGKGSDWTDGCIALRDEDMDILYSSCSKGTSVIIVGSLKPLRVFIQ
jgi:murein L,D-transpeptidase YafK